MSELIEVTVLTVSTGERQHCTIVVASDDDGSIEFREAGQRSGATFEGDDLFACMVALRRALERDDRMLLCNGARKDLYPSGMARQMAGGRVGYRVEIGKLADMEALLDIFDEAPEDAVATIEEQEAYFLAWVSSQG